MIGLTRTAGQGDREVPLLGAVHHSRQDVRELPGVQQVAVLTGGGDFSDLPEEVGYAFFRAMWEGGKSQWQRAYPSAANNNVIELTLRRRSRSTPERCATLSSMASRFRIV